MSNHQPTVEAVEPCPLCVHVDRALEWAAHEHSTAHVRAQVHATLALAWATRLARHGPHECDSRVDEAWEKYGGMHAGDGDPHFDPAYDR